MEGRAVLGAKIDATRKDTKVGQGSLTKLQSNKIDVNDLETNKADPKIYLTGLFILLIQKTSSDNKTIAFAGSIKLTTIDRIVNALKKHFFRKYSAFCSNFLSPIMHKNPKISTENFKYPRLLIWQTTSIGGCFDEKNHQRKD